MQVILQHIVRLFHLQYITICVTSEENPKTLIEKVVVTLYVFLYLFAVLLNAYDW